jgi:hypothetical protein
VIYSDLCCACLLLDVRENVGNMHEVCDWALLLPREDDTDNFAALCKNKRAGISPQGEWLAMATNDRVFEGRTLKSLSTAAQSICFQL